MKAKYKIFILTMVAFFGLSTVSFGFSRTSGSSEMGRKSQSAAQKEARIMAKKFILERQRQLEAREMAKEFIAERMNQVEGTEERDIFESLEHEKTNTKLGLFKRFKNYIKSHQTKPHLDKSGTVIEVGHLVTFVKERDLLIVKKLLKHGKVLVQSQEREYKLPAHSLSIVEFNQVNNWSKKQSRQSRSSASMNDDGRFSYSERNSMEESEDSHSTVLRRVSGK